MATRDVPLPLRPDQVENLSGPASRMDNSTSDAPGSAPAEASPSWCQEERQRTLSTREHFGLCIYFEHNKVHNKLADLTPRYSSVGECLF